MKSEYYIHRAFLIAFFLLSAFLISFPKAENMGILPLLAAFVLVAVLYFSALKFKENKTLKICVAAGGAVLAVFQISEIALFFKENALNNTPKILIMLVFLVCVSFVAVLGEAPILKFSLLSLPLAFFIVLLIFLLSLGSFQRLGVEKVLLPSGESFLVAFLECVLRFLPIVVLVFFRADEGKDIKRDLLGAFIGFALISLCFFNIVFLKSSGSFPYFGASDAVSVGNVFSRISGFSYFLFFVASLVSVGASICVIKSTFKIFKNNLASLAFITFLGLISFFI